jgi:pyruvate/2-oxoglutarate dehydrogenase complex dihydrolipoamide dehydrogenase (E3) component
MSNPRTSDRVGRDFRTHFRPLDRHDRALLDNVHPQAWENPEPAPCYHLVVIGGGTAGLVSAAAAAGLGATVALVERAALGGDCLNHGCVPSKALINAARLRKELGHRGIQSPPDDFTRAMDEVRRVRAKISHHDSATRFSSLGVDVFLGTGSFASRNVVEVDGTRLRFRRAIVATGARPTIPPMPGLADSGYLTNQSVFNLTELPRRLAILGAGPVGCEMAQCFARFGSNVTLLDVASRVLPRDDPEASALLADALRRDRVALELGARVTDVRRESDEMLLTYHRNGEQHLVRCDELLVAAGRSANVEDVRLDAGGVRFSNQGIAVDDRLRTSNRRVYAVGDVASRYKFTHAADALARIAIQNALFFGRKKASGLVIPWCTYTDPEIAHVGMDEADAEKRGFDVETLTVPLSDVDRAVVESAEDGFLRILATRGKGRVLGATLVAPHAGDIIGEICLATTHRLGLGKISSTIHPYPTYGEIVRKAGDLWMRGRLTPTVKTILRALLRVLR